MAEVKMTRVKMAQVGKQEKWLKAKKYRKNEMHTLSI